MKKTIKIYIEFSDLQQLESKASELGYKGRAWLSRFIEKIAREDLVFLDKNFKKIARAFIIK